VSRFGTLLLGVRLALAGGPGRLALMTTGVGLGLALLLGGLGVLPAYHLRNARVADRTPAAPLDPDGSPVASREGVVSTSMPDRFRGRQITVVRVAAVGRAPVPPGLRRLPAAGEIAVSPALGALLRDPANGVLRARYVGRVVATVGTAGLLGPHELLAYVGVQRSALPAGLEPLPAFGAIHAYRDLPAPDEVRAAVGLGLVGLLVPVLVFIATATRLSSAARERRLAAIRLVGATPEQARLLAAAEAGVAAMVGVVLGGLLFLTLRQAAAAALPVPAGVFPVDLAPPGWQLALVLLGVPVLAVATGLVALRHIVTSPLGVTRQGRVRRAGAARLLPLGTGLVLLALAGVNARAVTGGRLYGAALLVGGAALVLIGLAVGMPALARLAAAGLVRRGGGVAGQLAGRRLQLDPTPVARVVTGTVLVVFMAGWLMAFLPLLARASSNPYHELAAAVRPGTVLIQNGATAEVASRAARVPGVRGVSLVRQINGRTPTAATDGPGLSIVLVDCAALNALLRRPLPRCGEVPGYRMVSAGPQLAPAPGELVTPDTPYSGPAIRVPAGLLPVARAQDFSELGVYGDLVLSPAAVPREALAAAESGAMFIGTDGRPDTVERVRTALAGTSVFDVVTPADLIADAERPATVYTRLLLLGVVVAVLVAAASLALTSVDAVREQRRSFAALVAAGTPTGVLRRSVLVQTVLPLFLGVAVATACAGFAAAVYLGIGGEPRVGVPWLSMVGIGAAAVVAVSLATAATLPAVRATTRPSALRSE